MKGDRGTDSLLVVIKDAIFQLSVAAKTFEMNSPR